MNEPELIYIINTLLEDGLNFQNLEADSGRPFTVLADTQMHLKTVLALISSGKIRVRTEPYNEMEFIYKALTE